MRKPWWLDGSDRSNAANNAYILHLVVRTVCSFSGTTYVAMAFTVWEWLSGFAILLIGSLRTSSIEYDRTRRLLPAGRIIVRFFQVITAIAAALGFAAMMNGIYSIIKILSPEVTDFLMSKSIGNEHVVVTVWFTVIGALNVAFGGIAAFLHSYFAVRLNSVLK